MVSPAEFIPVAEQARLINRLTDGVLREACEQARAWLDAGLPAITMSVNLSPADFKRQDIVSTVTSILEASRVSGTRNHRRDGHVGRRVGHRHPERTA